MNISKTIFFILLFGYAFLYLPLFFVIINAFSDVENPSAWISFQSFLEVLADDDLLQAALNSLKIASIAATVSVVLGFLAAVSISKNERRFLGKTLLSKGMLIPVMTPDIIVGFSLLTLFTFMESLFGFPKERGVIIVSIGHAVVSVAYVYVTIKSKLQAFDRHLIDAATDLGARPLSVFLRIKIPMLKESIAASWLLSFTLSLDDLVVANFLASPGNMTLPMRLFALARFGTNQKINSFAAMFVAVVFACSIFSYLLLRRRK